jgi:NitT/TauT family transport system ATP-binding protein
VNAQVRPADAATGAAGPAPFIEFENASITYGKGARAVQALAPTSLKITEGEFMALVGPSGCGKSTILKMVGELLKPSTGYVFVAGREIGANPIRIGMAYQNPTLLPWLNIRDNVMLPLKIVPPFRQAFRAKRKGEFRDRVESLL